MLKILNWITDWKSHNRLFQAEWRNIEHFAPYCSLVIYDCCVGDRQKTESKADLKAKYITWVVFVDILIMQFHILQHVLIIWLLFFLLRMPMLYFASCICPMNAYINQTVMIYLNPTRQTPGYSTNILISRCQEVLNTKVSPLQLKLHCKKWMIVILGWQGDFNFIANKHYVFSFLLLLRSNSQLTPQFTNSIIILHLIFNI